MTHSPFTIFDVREVYPDRAFAREGVIRPLEDVIKSEFEPIDEFDRCTVEELQEYEGELYEEWYLRQKGYDEYYEFFLLNKLKREGKLPEDATLDWKYGTT